MACKKSELLSVINSFTNARLTGDANLINFSTNLLQQLVDTLDFEPETEETVSSEEAAE